MEPQAGDGLLVVDVQNDFMPGGALGVQRGDEIIVPINRCIERFGALRLPVFFSRDWHPQDHCSFHERGGPWPPHCVAGSAGAAFSPLLRMPEGATVVSKATSRDAEAYSALDGTGLHERLQAAGVRRLFIGGLATDYCVLNTVRDALRLGYQAVVLSDAVRAVDVQPGDGERALAEMRAAGAGSATTAELGA